MIRRLWKRLVELVRFLRPIKGDSGRCTSEQINEPMREAVEDMFDRKLGEYCGKFSGGGRRRRRRGGRRNRNRRR